MASAQTMVHLPYDTPKVSHHLGDGVTHDRVFLNVEAHGVKVCFVGSTDDLTELLRQLAEEVDNGERALRERSHEPMLTEAGS